MINETKHQIILRIILTWVKIQQVYFNKFVNASFSSFTKERQQRDTITIFTQSEKKLHLLNYKNVFWIASYIFNTR